MKSSASPREAEQNAAVRSARRERIARTLTFWLRPRFVLQVVNRFQKVAGFDRAIALASSALTALIPLAVVASAFSEKLGGKDTAQRIIDRYDLTGGGAEAVRDIFAPASAAGGGLGLAGAVFVLLALLSFARMMQRLFEQAWELEPLSVRNTPNQLLWLCGLSVYLVLSGFLHSALGERPLELAATLLTVPLCAILLIWTGPVLTAGRLTRRQLLPFGVLGAVLILVYTLGAQVYVPHLFSTYATRYGVVGAVFAMISALFCIAVVLVGSTAAGREVHDELERIRRGERPPDDEVRRQWAEITGEARSRWVALRQRTPSRRGARRD